MCLSMNVIGDGSTLHFVLGIVIGLAGIAGVSLTYPIYKKLCEKGKQKYASDTLCLANEISEEKSDERLKCFNEFKRSE